MSGKSGQLYDKIVWLRSRALEFDPTRKDWSRCGNYHIAAGGLNQTHFKQLGDFMINDQMEITMSAELNELFSALSKAQSTIQAASKDKNNPFFKSKYADLSSVWEACRVSLTNNGLSIIQIPQSRGDKFYLVSILGHSSGQWIKGEIEIPISKKDPQSVGSGISYFRRYMLSSLVGVAPGDDDDGEKAQAPYRVNGSHAKSITEPVVSKISPQQVEEFSFILGECDEKYQNWFYDYIGKQYKAEKIADLPADIYPKMKEAATKNMDSSHAKQRAALAEVQ